MQIQTHLADLDRSDSDIALRNIELSVFRANFMVSHNLDWETEPRTGPDSQI